MDELFKARIDNIVNEMNNLIGKEHVDSDCARTLMSVAVHRISLLMTHIGYIESKLQSTIQQNALIAEHSESLVAENQRLSQIAKY